MMVLGERELVSFFKKNKAVYNSISSVPSAIKIRAAGIFNRSSTGKTNTLSSRRPENNTNSVRYLMVLSALLI